MKSAEYSAHPPLFDEVGLLRCFARNHQEVKGGG